VVGGREADGTLTATMETMDAVVRRPLPPVPRSGSAQETRQAAEQLFVARMRSRAAALAAAGGAVSAVIAEVVPPARHRRARCRAVLRHPDGSQTDTTFVGPAGLPTLAAREWFDGAIRRWLAGGGRRDPAWLVADPGAQGGVAVDISAWQAATASRPAESAADRVPSPVALRDDDGAARGS
jgi:hypothetical protein